MRTRVLESLRSRDIKRARNPPYTSIFAWTRPNRLMMGPVHCRRLGSFHSGSNVFLIVLVLTVVSCAPGKPRTNKRRSAGIPTGERVESWHTKDM